MDDISEKIKELLNDEESMQQIKELAEMLGGASSSDDESGSSECFDPKPPPSSGGTNGMPDIGKMLAGLSGNTSGMPDMGMIMQLSEILRSTSENDRSRAFLLALRPLLSAEKQKKIDKAVRLMRIYAVFITMKKKGMLNKLEDIL